MAPGQKCHKLWHYFERYLLAEMSDVYSGFFASLCDQKRYDEALQELEKERGRDGSAHEAPATACQMRRLCQAALSALIVT
jgi:hypothetical protein